MAILYHSLQRQPVVLCVQTAKRWKYLCQKVGNLLESLNRVARKSPLHHSWPSLCSIDIDKELQGETTRGCLCTRVFFLEEERRTAVTENRLEE
ncbi:hypothetical protein SUGI_0853040 [Cryptomeria japonica]|nr:hypothetical protein SUGI_0853040 [Cryptomeria japonica]